LEKRKTASSTKNGEAESVDTLANAYLSTKDCYAYALILLDDLFSKEELSNSLMFATKRSPYKSGLHPKRMQRLISLVDKQYPGQLDMKVLKQKINQKCRDSSVVKVKKEKVENKVTDKISSQDNGEQSSSKSPGSFAQCVDALTNCPAMKAI